MHVPPSTVPPQDDIVPRDSPCGVVDRRSQRTSMAGRKKPVPRARPAAPRRSAVTGPSFYVNLVMAESGAPPNGSFEVTLFSDARLTGCFERESSPYTLINLVPVDRGTPRLRPTICMRVSNYLPDPDGSLPDMTRTQDHHFHGGQHYDEIAALLSLALGVRMKSSGVNRIFEDGADARGKPIAWYWKDLPALTFDSGRAPVLPCVSNSAAIGDAARISSCASLTPGAATALVRSAMLYAQALWVAETDPNQAWLYMVSAVEAAANCWSSDKSTPEELLRFSHATICAKLDALHPAAVAAIAPDMTMYLGATKKFCGFLLTHLPSPPNNRPAEGLRLDYSASALTAAFKKIYSYRSRALHRGVPFPPPMYDPPYRATRQEPYSEIPLGLASSSHGSTWTRSDTPMTLHTFEYIARNAVLFWWDTMIQERGK